MRNWVRHVDGLIGNLSRFNWRHSIQKRAEKMTDAELSEMLARIPSAERRTAWLRVARQPYSEAELDESRAVLTGMVEQMGLRHDQITYPMLLRQAGYHTAVVGKWHIQSMPRGFDHWAILRGPGSYFDPQFLVNDAPVRFRGHTADVLGDQALT